VKFIVQSISEPELSEDAKVRVRVPASRLSASVVENLKLVLTNHPGSAPVFIHMTSEGDEKVLRVGPEHNVEPRSALFAELRELLGPSSVF
jgi:DNA polymerase-3 subunit alpha